MKHLLIGLPVSLLVLVIYSTTLRAAASEDSRLSAFFQTYLEEAFRRRPLEATRLGDHRFDHLLDDISAKARAGWTEHYRQTLAELPREDRLGQADALRPDRLRDLQAPPHDRAVAGREHPPLRDGSAHL
jgi:hypothetical protein